MSEARKELEKQLKYSPVFMVHKGQMVKLTLDNYEEVTGRKLPD